MRTFAFACAALMAACSQPAQQAPAPSDPMGPMPVVAAFYDSGELRSDAAWNSVWFTQELANAIEANATGPAENRLAFDYRSWSSDPEVEDIRYAVGEHAEEGKADIVTRFAQEGEPGGMHLTWRMCRRADGQWRIEDITGQHVAEPPAPGDDEATTLRVLLGLAPPTPASCA